MNLERLHPLYKLEIKYLFGVVGCLRNQRSKYGGPKHRTSPAATLVHRPIQAKL